MNPAPTSPTVANQETCDQPLLEQLERALHTHGLIERVEISLVEPTESAPPRIGLTYSGILRIPAWPDCERGAPGLATDCFLIAEGARVDADPTTDSTRIEIGDRPNDSCLLYRVYEDGAGGELHFRLTPTTAGIVGIEFLSLVGDTGVYDPEGRTIWRLVQVEFEAVAQ